MYFSIRDIQCSWLVDTGASISAIKLEQIQNLNIPYKEERLNVKGIGGEVVSKGYVYLNLCINDESFRHKFYVFENLPCKTNGILGQDFFSNYNAVLNYEKDTLNLQTLTGKRVIVQFENHDEESKMYFVVPARSETVHFMRTSMEEECVVHSQQLCEGVFVANTVVRNVEGRVPVRILNTREEDIRLSCFSLRTTSLKDYEVCEFEKPVMNADRVKRLFSVLNLKGLNHEEQVSIENICAKFPDVFHLAGDKLSCTKLYEQSIQLKPDTNPVYVKPYRLPHAQKSEIEKQIKNMLQDEIIEETRSEWSSPLLLVPKKVDATGEKKWRVVIDYRKLNQQVQDDKFPLPNITEILDSLSGAMYFSHLDLYQGYYQVMLTPESRKVTAFTSSTGQYQMKRLPMGLKTSPSAFSRMMTVAMSGLTYEKCFVYLDDLVVFGRNLEQHNKNLLDIFARLRKVNLKLNPVKCEFLRKEILYLGHVVTQNGILPDPEKTKVLEKYPKPKNADDVKRFVAFSNYYRKFIPNFAQKANPLNNLSRKDVPFVWTDQCENAFQELKTSLSTPPVLQYPNFDNNNEFILTTDASNVSVGSVLCNNDERPIAYASRTLNKAEKNYPTIEKELLAIVWSVKYFRPYLYARHFKIQTDHKPLVYLFNMRDPSSRLLKFRLCLEEYNFTIEYVKGSSNVVADALSRVSVTSDQLKEMSERVMNVMTRAQSRKQNQQTNNSIIDGSLDNGIADSATNPKVVEILKKTRSMTELTWTNKTNLRKLRRQGLVTKESTNYVYVPSKSTIYFNSLSQSLTTRDVLVRELESFCNSIKVEELCIVKSESNKSYIEGLTQEIKRNTKWSGPRICIIKGVQKVEDCDDQRMIINDFHLLPTSGHAGIRRMVNNIKKYYYWPTIEKDVQEFVKKCDKCQKQKYCLKTKQPMVITTTATSAFDKVYLDIVGPINKDVNDYAYILTLQCELTKFVEAYPLQSKHATSVARSFVENFVLRYGIPREIATDRGSEFIASTMKEVCTLLKVNHITSTAYHHESIGALENSHKTMGAYLRIVSENQPNTWSGWLPYWCFTYNNTVNTETRYTPHELVFGKICNLPSNLKDSYIEPLYNHDSYPLELKYRLKLAQKDARENLHKGKMLRKQHYDKCINPVQYEKGSLVLLRNISDNKTQSIYLGPYLVLEDLEPNVKIQKDGKIEIVHKNRTKKYYS